MLKRKGVSDEKGEATADSSNGKNAEASGGSDAWFSFHCVMDLEAISSTYPQTIDFCFAMLCNAFCCVFFINTMARNATSEETLCQIVTPSVASFIVKHHLYSFHSE